MLRYLARNLAVLFAGALALFAFPAFDILMAAWNLRELLTQEIILTVRQAAITWAIFSGVVASLALLVNYLVRGAGWPVRMLVSAALVAALGIGGFVLIEAKPADLFWVRIAGFLAVVGGLMGILTRDVEQRSTATLDRLALLRR